MVVENLQNKVCNECPIGTHAGVSSNFSGTLCNLATLEVRIGHVPTTRDICIYGLSRIGCGPMRKGVEYEIPTNCPNGYRAPTDSPLR